MLPEPKEVQSKIHDRFNFQFKNSMYRIFLASFHSIFDLSSHPVLDQHKAKAQFLVIPLITTEMQSNFKMKKSPLRF